MPQTSTPFRRFFSVPVLAFHLAVFGAWQALESRPTDPQPHVERAGGADCPAPHDEALCRICQVASHRLMASHAGPLVPVLERCFARVSPTAEAWHAIAVPRVGGPRAPPANG
jgi:hypothetical protein